MEAFDKEIENHLEVLRGIHERRNERAPISRLPPEIICRIFMLCTLNWGHSFRQLCRRPDRHLWVKVTHVCRRWRIIALDYPLLWSYVPVGIPGRWISEMLVRSGELALTIDGSQEGTGYHLFDTVFQHLHRFRSFKVTRLHWERSPALSDRVIQMPCLEELSVILPRPYFASPYPQLRELKAPSLRTLSLGNCIISENSWRFQSHTLAHLTINLGGRYFEYTMLLDILQHTPQLQFLAFSQNVEGIEIEDIPSQSSHQLTVKLPHLATLHIKSEGDFCAAVFNHLNFPKSASIQTTSPTVRPLLPRIAAQCNTSLGGQAVRFLYAQSTIIPQGTRVATQLVHPGGPGENETNFGICVTWTTPDVPFPVGRRPAFIDLVRTLDLSLLTELHVHGLNSLSPLDWLEADSSMSKVTMIKMGTANFALAAALGEWSSVSDGGVPNLQYRLRLCPHLRRLTVEGANFNQRLGHYGRFGDVVRDCLDIRKQAGVRVDVLEVTNCPMVSEDDAQFLEKSVGIVTWHRVDVGLQDEGRDAESTLLLVR